MKVEGFEDGTVLCDGTICEKWIESETTCENCPIDSLFRKVLEHNIEQWKLKQDHEVHDDN